MVNSGLVGLVVGRPRLQSTRIDLSESDRFESETLESESEGFESDDSSDLDYEPDDSD